MLKNFFLWLFIAVCLTLAFNSLETPVVQNHHFSYSELVNQVEKGEIESATIRNDDSVSGTLKSKDTFNSYLPIRDPKFFRALVEKAVVVQGQPTSLWVRLLLGWIPALLPIIIIFSVMRQVMGQGRESLSFMNSRARSINPDDVKTKLSDVAGADEAKAEVQDLIDFLKSPEKVYKLGAKIPRGILLMGAPGTGKTLLAKAVAGEAKVPFFSIAGSEFSEMFVGVGAARVRSLFAQAKKNAPCIIFIDEIDAVGHHRNTAGSGHDDQALMQLLVEMDGFSDHESVVVMAATNRPGTLDKALIRSGRFDRQVVFNLPDIQGRHQILQVHLKKVKIDQALVDPMILARGTPGMSGADIQNMVNEAALYAARLNQGVIDMVAFEKAKDKIMMGAERSMIMSPDEKKLTAYHEAGHAIIGWCMGAQGHDPVHKVTILPRGRALGLTMFLPNEDKYSYTKQRLKAQLASLFGGRLAEELVFGVEHITTGASNDIQRATEIARDMVVKWGLSETMGPLNYETEQEQSWHKPYSQRGALFSEETIKQIDEEVRSIIKNCYETAKNILETNMQSLHQMADMLMQYETIDAHQVAAIMSNDTTAGAASPSLALEAKEEEKPKRARKRKATKTSTE